MLEYNSNALIEFSMIVDTDVGVLRLINEEYCDESIFYKNITNIDDKHLKGLLMLREYNNPLIVAFIDEGQKDLMNSLYKQFLTKEYEKILRKSVLTQIFLLFRSFSGTDGIVRPTVLCNNEMEVKIVKEIMTSISEFNYEVKLRTESLFDVSQYTDIYVKDINNLFSYKNIVGKNLFVNNAIYNVDIDKYQNDHKKIPPEKIYCTFNTCNDIRYVTIYEYNNSYFFDDSYMEQPIDQEPSVKRSKYSPFVKKILGDTVDKFDIPDEEENKDEVNDEYFENNEEWDEDEPIITPENLQEFVDNFLTIPDEEENK